MTSMEEKIEVCRFAKESKEPGKFWQACRYHSSDLGSRECTLDEKTCPVVHLMHDVPKNKIPKKRYRDPVKFVEDCCDAQTERIKR